MGTVVTRLEGTKHVQNVQSPYARGNQGTLSEDGKSALVTFELAGDDTADKVGPALAAVSKLDRQEAGFRIEEFGDASADKALDQAFEDDFQKAEVTSLPITLIILILAFGALLAAFVPLLLAVTAVARDPHVVHQKIARSTRHNFGVLLIGLAWAGLSAFYIRPSARSVTRDAVGGRAEEAAATGARSARVRSQ